MDFEKFAVLSMNNLAQAPKSHYVGFYRLWFDVEKGRLTTTVISQEDLEQLWFDVEKGRLTTIHREKQAAKDCGLM